MNVRKSTESSWLTLTLSPGVGLQPNVCIHSSDLVGSESRFRDGLQSRDRTWGQGLTLGLSRTLEWGWILGLGRTTGQGVGGAPCKVQRLGSLSIVEGMSEGASTRAR